MGKKEKNLKEEVKEENIEIQPEEVKQEDVSKEEGLEAKILEIEDLLKRQVADFDNYRKRAIEEKDRIKDIVAENLIVDFLPIFDNIERAFESCKNPETTKEAIQDGFAGIIELFSSFLEKQGVVKLDSIGQPFDSKIHEALFTKEGDYEFKEVIQEVEKAYTRKDKVIRTAKVAVGVPKETK